MKLTELHDRLLGDWVGTNLLRTTWEAVPEHHSASRMTVAPVAKGKFLGLTYTWSHEGKDHEGFLLVGNANSADAVSAAFVDSWHQGGKVMLATGSIDDAGVVHFFGTFEAPPDPDWGWRFALSSPSADELLLEMWVVPPQGDEDLAVRAQYRRA